MCFKSYAFFSRDTITRQIDRVQRRISEPYEHHCLKDNIVLSSSHLRRIDQRKLFEFLFRFNCSWAWPTHGKLLLYLLFIFVGLADEKYAEIMRPHLADVNDLCIQKIDVDHVTIAGPTPCAYYRRLFSCSIGFWPTKKSKILVVIRLSWRALSEDTIF